VHSTRSEIERAARAELLITAEGVNPKAWEIKYSELQLIKEAGQGFYGIVYKVQSPNLRGTPYRRVDA
jgi:hypothetical protein